MSIIERLIKRVVATLPSRTITTDGKPYLTRWYLWPRGPRTVADSLKDDAVTPNAPFAVFIHYFHRGDDDRDLHSHPWSTSVALVLTGGYREEREDGFHIKRPGSINIINAEDFHRVELLNPKQGCWTLFVAGTNTKEWGFRDRKSGRFIPWREYLGGDNTVS